MPLSVLEAMAHGLPVLGVDIGDVKLMVAPANQPFIVPPVQESLAAALTELMKSSASESESGQKMNGGRGSSMIRASCFDDSHRSDALMGETSGSSAGWG
jgi:glycosyltransferase involved in cell wall biosynthesis